MTGCPAPIRAADIPDWVRGQGRLPPRPRPEDNLVEFEKIGPGVYAVCGPHESRAIATGEIPELCELMGVEQHLLGPACDKLTEILREAQGQQAALKRTA